MLTVSVMIATRENRSTAMKMSRIPTNPTWTDLVSNPDLRGEVLATNYLSHGTAFNLLKPSLPRGLTLKNSAWCPHCVYVFCSDLRTSSDFCLIKH
jgi:hypothetical protein